MTVPLTEAFYRRGTDVQCNGMTCLKSLGKSVVEQIVHQIPTPCLTTKPVSLLPFLSCFIFPFHFSLLLSSSLMLSSLPSSPWQLKHVAWMPAASLCHLISHGSPFAPSIALTALTVVDHHSNSTGVVRMNIKEISYCDFSRGKMHVQMGSRALGEPWQVSWFIQWIEANMMDLPDLAHQEQNSCN